MLRKERARHGSRLVQIEINSNSMLARPGHEFAEIAQSNFMIRAESLVPEIQNALKCFIHDLRIAKS